MGDNGSEKSRPILLRNLGGIPDLSQVNLPRVGMEFLPTGEFRPLITQGITPAMLFLAEKYFGMIGSEMVKKGWLATVGMGQPAVEPAPKDGGA